MRTDSCSWGRGPGALILRLRSALQGGAGSPSLSSDWGDGGLFAPNTGGASVGPDPDEAEIEEAIAQVRAFSEELYDLCLLSWMSSEGLEGLLLDAAREAGRSGPAILFDYSKERIRLLWRGCARVEREIHRLAGLARFDLRRDGIYSAPLEPDHSILPALAPHFLGRFGGLSFALVDCRRRLCILSLPEGLRFLEGDDALRLLPDAESSDAERLWRRYFAATENPQRRNPGLQRRFMPERYWKYLVELRI